MKRPFAAAMRRANRLMRPAKLSKAAKSLQKMMTGLALAPLAALVPTVKTARKAKPGRKPKLAKPKVGQTLATVLQQLRKVQGVAPEVAADDPPRLAAGAQYLTRTHRTAAGSRGYKLYLPAHAPKGLIVMLHGCKQNPDDFARGTDMNRLAEKHDLAVAYPGQTARHNPAACWNWFAPSNQRRSSGEPAILASLTRKLMQEFGLKREVVFVAGLSAGGAMAAILADVYPDLFAAAGIHSGLARGAAHDVFSAMAAMRSGGTGAEALPDQGAHPPRRIIFQGDADSTVHPANAEMLLAAAVGAGAEPAKTSRRSVNGRTYVRRDYGGAGDAAQVQLWVVEGAGHAWSGGNKAGSYADSVGPDASALMIRFFLAESGMGKGN